MMTSGLASTKKRIDKMKKSLAFLLAIMMLISLFPGAALAAEGQHNEDGYIGIMPLNVVIVSTESELFDAIQTAPTDGTQREIILEASFNLSDNYFTSSNSWIRNKNLVINGNGHTLTRVTATRHFLLNQGTKMTLKNIILTSQVCGTSGTHGGIQVSAAIGDSANLILEDGAAIRGNFSLSGGGVFIAQGGTLTMYGGEISGNTSTGPGGGVTIQDGTFIMRGGEISGNTAGPIGGGGVANFNVFRLYGGTISGNTSSSLGGGVANINTLTQGGGELSRFGIFTMNGGVIDNNTAPIGGGVSSTSRFVMNGGVISNNIANINRGGIFHGATSVHSDTTF